MCFLGPSFFLTPSEIFKAKRHLSVLWIHNSSLNKKIVESKNSDSDVVEVEEIQENLNDFEQMLQMEAAKRKPTLVEKSVDIMPKLNEFEVLHLNGPRLPSNVDILQFYNARKHEMPEIYLLAEILFAVPATQVSVERLFSNLAFIFSPLRSNLTRDCLESTLIIRSSKQF